MEPGPLDKELAIGADAAELKIRRQVSARIGGEYFRAMTTYLRQELNADCVFVEEFTPGSAERVTPLAACLEGEQTSLTFNLAGIVSSRIARTGRSCLSRENLPEAVA